MSDRSQLERLAKPFPARFVHTNPSGGGSYVTHSVVNEKLLAVLGGFDFELVEVLRGYVAAIIPNPSAKSQRGRDGAPALDAAIVGVVCRLSAMVDGRRLSVEEVGDCEQPHNWPHDGARLKDAMSDALKRCAMRLGCGLHLWSDEQFTLYKQLVEQSRSGAESEMGEVSGETGAASAVPTRESAEGAASDRPIFPEAPEVSPNQLETLNAKFVSLGKGTVAAAAQAKKWGLPPMDKCNAEQFAQWVTIVDVHHKRLAEPFEKAAT